MSDPSNSNEDPAVSFIHYYRHYQVFHAVARAGGIKPALKDIPWRLSVDVAKDLLDELEEVRGERLYRDNPFALEPAGKALAAKLDHIMELLDKGLTDLERECEADGIAAGPSPTPIEPDAPQVPSYFGEEDRSVSEECARHNFPFYFAIATEADAEALISTVTAQACYIGTYRFPRDVPEIRHQLELECNKWEQLFLASRDQVRASATFARLSDEQRQRIESVAFLFPEAEPEPD